MRSLIARSVLVILGCTMIAMALITIFSPEVGNKFLPPVELGDAAQATMIRTYAGFWLGCGYLTIRFVYSSSKVQIGSPSLSNGTRNDSSSIFLLLTKLI